MGDAPQDTNRAHHTQPRQMSRAGKATLTCYAISQFPKVDSTGLINWGPVTFPVALKTSLSSNLVNFQEWKEKNALNRNNNQDAQRGLGGSVSSKRNT